MDPLLTEISSKFYSELVLAVSEALSTPYKNLYVFFLQIIYRDFFVMRQKRLKNSDI